MNPNISQNTMQKNYNYSRIKKIQLYIMEEKLINIIDYERAWKKTLLYKFGKKTLHKHGKINMIEFMKRNLVEKLLLS